MAEARNIGFEQSNGDYIYHVDADMELSSDVVQECVDFCINQEYDALLIPEENIGGGYWSNCLKFGKRINRREQKGNLRFVDSDLYSQVGGHDPKRLSGEDWDLHRRVASEQDVKIGHIDKLVKHHVESMGFFDIISKSNTYAKSQADIPDDDRRPLDATGNIKKHLAHFDIFMLNPLHSIGYAIISIVNALMARYYRYKGDVYKDN
jgi:glycosyltransferase involved in cell wall biosynthesis